MHKFMLVSALTFVCSLFFAGAQFTYDPISNAAFANEGRVDNIDNSSKKKDKTKKKKKKKPIDPKAAFANDYKPSKYRDIRELQERLAKSARHRDLEDIGRSEKELSKFVKDYEKLQLKYKGIKALELNKVFSQLKKYKKNKKYKKAATYAGGLLYSFAVYDRYLDAKYRYKQWKEADNELSKHLTKKEYERAQKAYYKARGKLPKGMQQSFPVIKDIP